MQMGNVNWLQGIFESLVLNQLLVVILVVILISKLLNEKDITVFPTLGVTNEIQLTLVDDHMHWGVGQTPVH